MTDDRSLERAARAWLEEGPTRAPEHAVKAALLQIETTAQEWDWPVPHLHVRMRLAGTAMTGMALVGVGLIGAILLLQPGPGPGPAISPSLSPTTSASPQPSSSSSPSSSASGATAVAAPEVLTATFVSPRNGYSVLYPADWIATAGTSNWLAGSVNLWGSSALDELRGSTARFVGASQPLQSGQTADEWLANFAAGACLTPKENWIPVPIGASAGFIDADGCEAPDPPLGKGGPLFDAVVIVGNRAYSFTMDGEVSHSDFVSVLATVTLDPESAVDPSPSP